MAFLLRLFRSAPPEPKPTPEPADLVGPTVERLTASLETLNRREDSLREEIELNTIQAKQRLRAGDQHNAKLYLQKAKLAEISLGETISHKFNLSAQVSALQNTSFNSELVETMVQSRDTFKALGTRVNPEAVRVLVQEVKDEMAKSSQVQSAISGPMVTMGDVSEALAKMQDEIDLERQKELDEQLLALPMPDRVHDPRPTVVQREERKALLLTAPIVSTHAPPVAASARTVEPTPVLRPGPRVVSIERGHVVDSRMPARMPTVMY